MPSLAADGLTSNEAYSMNNLAKTGESNLEIIEPSNVQKRLSQRRWLVLAAFSSFTFLLGLTDPSTNSFLIGKINYLREDYEQMGRAFTVLTILVALPASWLVGAKGIKSSIYYATYFLLFRDLFNALIFSADSNQSTYWYIACICQVVIDCIIYSMPLQICETWFSSKTRSFAWTLMITSQSAGTQLASYLSERYLTRRNIDLLYYLYVGSAIVTGKVVFMCLSRSQPRDPPNSRAVRIFENKIGPMESLMKLATDKNFLMHIVHIAVLDGCRVGMIEIGRFTSQKSNMELGWSAISFISWLTPLALSFLVHKYKKITKTTKFASFLSFVSFVLAVLASQENIEQMDYAAITTIYFLASSWGAQNLNNMTGHLASGNYSIPAIDGLLLALRSLIHLITANYLSKVQDDEDHSIQILVILIILQINGALYLIFFDGKDATNDDDDDDVE